MDLEAENNTALFKTFAKFAAKFKQNSLLREDWNTRPWGEDDPVNVSVWFQAVTNVTALAQVDREKIYQWINELSSPETRENALLELSKKRESVPDLAPMLWHSFGTIAALLQVRASARSGPVPVQTVADFSLWLQEIVNIYPSINPPTLTAHQSNRVCNALALLQCVASHPETR